MTDKTEGNQYVRWWIWIWYNDVTRGLLLLGLPSVIACIVCYLALGPGEYLRTVALVVYGFFFAWGSIDNNYSNLRRIGMDEYRRKLRI